MDGLENEEEKKTVLNTHFRRKFSGFTSATRQCSSSMAEMLYSAGLISNTSLDKTNSKELIQEVQT